VISVPTWVPESLSSSSVRHWPLLKFHMRAVPSLPVVIRRLLV
jgi:hypothetical protein